MNLTQENLYRFEYKPASELTVTPSLPEARVGRTMELKSISGMKMKSLDTFFL